MMLGVMFLALFGLAGVASAAILTVDSTNGNDTTASPDGSPYLTLHAAVAAANPGDTVEVAPGIHDLTSMLEITEAITLSGSPTSSTQIRAVGGPWPSDAKHLIGIYGGTEATPIVLEDLYLNANGKSFGVNTYFNAYGTLTDVTIRNSSGAALTVNGSTIIATDLLTEDNTLGGVNVDPDVGVTTESKFVLNSGNLTEAMKIWSDGDNVNAGVPAVTVQADGYTKLKVAGSEDSYYWVSGTMSQGAFVSEGDDNTFYPTIQEAIDAAPAGGTVQVFKGTYNENLTINKPLTLWGPNADKNPNTGSRNEEAVVNGGVGFALKPQAADIEIAGLTFTADATGEAIYNVGAEATDISNLLIRNNIIDGGVRGITIESGGDNVVILNNEIKGYERDIHFGDGTWTNLKINGNVILRPDTQSYAVQIFGPGTGSIVGFELKDNEFYGSSNIGANISNGTVSGNTFDVDGTALLALQIVLHDSTITGNTFNGSEEVACLQIYGSQYGLIPSSNVTISQNTFTDCGGSTAPFNFAIQLSQGISNITITDNTIDNAYDAINTRVGDGWDLTGANVTITENVITDTRGAGARNTVSGVLSALQNWWGSLSGPNDPTSGDGSIPDTNAGTGASVVGSVNYSDWCVSDNCTLPPGDDDDDDNSDDDDDGPTYGSRSSKSRPATPANPGVSPAFPSLNALLRANAQSNVSAAAFQFMRDLSIGMSGLDVMELQKRITQAGVYFGPHTGYFGPLTLAGVQRYQGMHGIPTTGYVGPLTRAELNAGSSELGNMRARLLSLLQQLVVKLQAQLNAQ